MRKFVGISACLFSILIFLSTCSQKSENASNYENGTILSEWNQVLTETIVQDLFSPPVASRIYAYSNIAAYEAIRHVSDHNSFAGKFNELNPLPQPVNSKEYNYSLAACISFVRVAKSLVYTQKVLDDYQNFFQDSILKTGLEKKVFDNSVKFGEQIADSIIAWSARDNFKHTRGQVRYNILDRPGSWIPTPPDYLPGAEPHWDEIRGFVLNKASELRPDSLPDFDTTRNSYFYSMAYEVYQAVNNLDSNQREMAVFWHDNPNVSTQNGHLEVFNQKMTPGGHWIAITSLVVKKNKLNMADAARTYALVAVGMADAFIICWDAKYTFQTIRPVTFINKYIDDKWSPILQTPPFPEFPSGHSTVSAAAATILTDLFGNNFSFTDSSEFQFGLPVRSFKSFYDASDEVAMSRFYGGIHFRPANVTGKSMGLKLGRMVNERTATQKP